jgi:hypothetical protein
MDEEAETAEIVPTGTEPTGEPTNGSSLQCIPWVAAGTTVPPNTAKHANRFHLNNPHISFISFSISIL